MSDHQSAAPGAVAPLNVTVLSNAPANSASLASSAAAAAAVSEPLPEPTGSLPPTVVTPTHHHPTAVEKHNALMSMITGTDFTALNGDAASLHAVPLPSFSDLLLQVREKQAQDPLALPQLITSDISDCFRLYFGSSVTTFPFFALRLGVMGYLLVLAAAGYVSVMTQLALHRTRYNLVLVELYRRMEREGSSNSASITSTDHHHSVELGMMTPPRSSSPTTSCPSSPATVHSPNPEAKKSKRKKKSKAPDDPSDMAPYFLKTGSLVKVCAALWPDHWMKDVVTGITCTAQFFSCCSFCMLFASNVAPVLGISVQNAIYLAAVAMGGLSLATAPMAKTALAACNNAFILGGACIILFYSFIHEQSEEEKAMSLQIVPKSIADLAMYAPALMSYLMAQLYTVDTETVVCLRANRMLQGKSPEPSPESLQVSPATSAASSVANTPVTRSPGGGFPLPTSNVTSGASTPSNSHLGASHGFFATALVGLRAEVLCRSMIVVETIQAVFGRSLWIGMISAVSVLAVFDTLIMYNFKDNTNQIIALSLPESTMRTCILVMLSIGLYACGTLSINPMAEMLDTLSASIEAIDVLIVKRILLRACFFLGAVIFLYLVPFFDMVAALMGAVCTPMFAFLIPTACELQSEMLKCAQHPSTKALMATGGLTQRLQIGWRSMCWDGKVSAMVSIVLGSVIFCFSTYEVVSEILRRHNEGV